MRRFFYYVLASHANVSRKNVHFLLANFELWPAAYLLQLQHSMTCTCSVSRGWQLHKYISEDFKNFRVRRVLIYLYYLAKFLILCQITVVKKVFYSLQLKLARLLLPRTLIPSLAHFLRHRCVLSGNHYAMSSSKPSFPYLDNSTCLRALVPWSDLVDKLASGMAELSEGKVKQPVRAVLKVEDHNGFAGK